MHGFERWARFFGSGDSKDGKNTSGGKEHPSTPAYLRKGARVSEDEARELLANPLRDFPFDIRPLTQKDVDHKKAHHAVLVARAAKDRASVDPVELAAEWDARRLAAVRRERGDVEWRAAQNDVLWLWFLGITEKGGKVTMAALKQRVELDVTRSKLWPTSAHLADVNRRVLSKIVVPEKYPADHKNPKLAGKPTGKMRALIRGRPPLRTVDYKSAKPPEWYVRSQRGTGGVESVVQALDALCKKRR